MHTKHVELAGSHRSPMPGSNRIGPMNPEERVEVTVRLRPRTPLTEAAHPKAFTARSVKGRHYLTHKQFADTHGATPEDIAEVEAFARSHKLAVVESSIPRRSVILSGHAAAVAAAFGVTLEEYSHPEGGSYRARSGPIMIPADLEGKIVGVFGLDNRPQAKPHFRTRKGKGRTPKSGADLTQFTPPQITSLYDFPTNVDGTGQCIAIIELGGGYSMSDLKTYFSGLNLGMPNVSSVSVDHAKNHPTRNPDGPDGEVMLDIEVAASVAPKAKFVVYFAPNTDQGFLDAVTKAVHDTTNKPSVISISWGGPESSWTDQAMQQFDQAFQAAAALGITVCIAAGDNGSSDGLNDGAVHVDFPASSPNVLACGGTTLNATASSIDSEVVWNDGANGGATGGGVSDEFPIPSYQQTAGVPPSASTGKAGRGMPDVAGDADPDTGYAVRVDGQNTVIGGTSAVAPLWAGLIALLNQSLGHPVGFLNPVLYSTISQDGAFRDITSGSNGAYSAGTGWDPCSGWGVADGQKLLQTLSQ
ncbi:MAG: protease pro-enzyme activation domain-containing protein [Isosphaeraceae bacterium]